ncbi:MAG: peptide chain release factor N(5)-glutamine methyltransferase [Clostridia bacterium]|nr:peptide chain release factor N(5)-glutamine methyltransferase [Clostridia bacterium]
MVIRELLQFVIEEFKNGGIENAIFEAHLLVRGVLCKSSLDIVLCKEDDVPKEKENVIMEGVRRRLKHEPLQYILGSQEFMSLSFKVTPDVLIPRADTEVLVEHIISKYVNQGMLALDIGTGSGCIGISLAVYNKNAYVRGLDISEKALCVARENAKMHLVHDRVSFELCDVLKDSIWGRYDVIVSNPPYIETDAILSLGKNVKDFEPVLALDGGADGLKFYRRIISAAPKLLNDSGILAFEVGHTQAQKVAQMMDESFDNIEFVKDLCGIERVVCGVKKPGHIYRLT